MRTIFKLFEENVCCWPPQILGVAGSIHYPGRYTGPSQKSQCPNLHNVMVYKYHAGFLIQQALSEVSLKFAVRAG